MTRNPKNNLEKAFFSAFLAPMFLGFQESTTSCKFCGLTIKFGNEYCDLLCEKMFNNRKASK